MTQLVLEFDHRGERFAREIRWLWVARSTPPSREMLHADGDHPGWIEWFTARGIDPYAQPASRVPIPRSLRMAVLERDGYVCRLCRGVVDRDDVHIDHVLPVARGGRNTLANLQVTHSVCNLRKGARVLEVIA